MYSFSDLDNLLPHLQTLSEELLEIYHSADITVITKGDNSPLSTADLHSNRRLTQILAPYGYPILSEELESSFDRSKTETFWVIDPLDGTKDFIQKTDEFAIMIGLVQEGEPIFGVVCVPAGNKIYFAQKGQGSFVLCDGKKTSLQVTSTDTIKGANLITSRNHFAPEMREFTDRYGLNLIKCGSNGVKMGLIAEGQADLLFNPTDKMGLWDACGPQIILEEAGGTVTDCRGERINYQQTSQKLTFGIAASNGPLHSNLTQFTRQISNSPDSI